MAKEKTPPHKVVMTEGKRAIVGMCLNRGLVIEFY